MPSIPQNIDLDLNVAQYNSGWGEGSYATKDDQALMMAVYDNNLPAVIKYLKQGADPSYEFLGKLSRPNSDSIKLSFPLQRKTALQLAISRGVNPEIALALAKATLEKDFHGNILAAAIVNGLALNPVMKNERNLFGPDEMNVYIWGAQDPARHAESVFAALSVTPFKKAPWQQLAEQGHLELIVARYIRAANAEEENPDLSDALAAGALRNRSEAARACFEVSGARLDTAPAKVEAAIGRHADFEAQLARPPHAYAISAGQIDWAHQQLNEPDLSWVNLNAPFRQAWGPLAAALERERLGFDTRHLAQKLIHAGASPAAPTESSLFQKTVSLLAERALANDEAGVKLLLLAGAPIASLNERSLSFEQAATPFGVVCSQGNLPMAQLLLLNGADPSAIPRRQLNSIAKTHPEIRALLGAQSPLSLFGQGVKNAIARIRAQKPKADTLLESSSAFNASGSASASSGVLNVAKALALMEKADFSAPLIAKGRAAAEQANELSALGGLPANEADALSLKRLWENNIPSFLQRLIEIPKEDRSSPPNDGGPSPIRLFEAMMDTAQDNMALMRSRALASARDRLDAEAAVIADSVGRSLESFKNMINRLEERATTRASALSQDGGKSADRAQGNAHVF